MPYKRIIGVLTAFIVILISSQFVFADNTDDDDYINQIPFTTVSAVDVSSGMFAGVNAAFYFYLPSEWLDIIELLDVDRVLFQPGGEILDRYNFYCRSASGLYRHQLIMSLIVFDKTKWRDNLYPYAVVLRTNDYVFAADMGVINSFRLNMDREAFDIFYEGVGTISQIKACVELPNGQQEEETFTVFVNGEKMPSGVELIDGIYHIALREVCEAFGYTVTWLDEERAVEVYLKDDYIDKIFITSDLTAYAPNISIRIINDRIYVPTAYFLRILRKNVEFDDRGNVVITSALRS